MRLAVRSKIAALPLRASGMRVALAAVFGGLISVAALALNFPTLTGRVVDEAGILDQPTRTALTQKLADLEAKTTDQLVVATLRSLQGTSIEDFGYQLGRYWKIGQQGKNNGVVLIVVPSERKVRIEVGYGLEGTLTDAVTKLIIENSILPRFRANDYPGGIARGVDDIIQVLTGDAEEWQRRAVRPASRQTDPFQWLFFAIFYGVIAWIILSSIGFPLIYSLLVALGIVKKRPRKGFWNWANSSSSGSSWGSSGWSSGSGSSWGSSDGGGFSGGGGSFGGGGSSGSW